MKNIIQGSSAAKSIYGCGDVPADSWLNYAFALLTVAGADGEVSAGEMEWLMNDFMAIIDAPEEFLKEIGQFDYKAASLEDILPNIQFDVSINHKRALLYDAIKMSHADNEYSSREREAVRHSAELLQVPVYMARTLEGLVNTEKSIEATRRSIFELDDQIMQRDEMPAGTRVASRLMQYNFGISFTSDEIEKGYGLALMAIAGADGHVSDSERDWYKHIFASMAKTPRHIVYQVINSDYINLRLEEIIPRLLKQGLPHGIAKTLLYNSIKMARADEHYPQAERDAVAEAARLLDIPVSIANTMNYLIDAEDKVEKMRKTLFELKSANKANLSAKARLQGF